MALLFPYTQFIYTFTLIASQNAYDASSKVTGIDYKEVSYNRTRMVQSMQEVSMFYHNVVIW